ncbi:MAG: FAD-dependent oxidoreductase [Clostridiales bacterium]|nr:FAD-dependent oxidoreductase [Clostridiales bacterium]
MKKVLVVGGGVAGCTAALALSAAGIPVLLIEKENEIGGKTAAYGCKACSVCTQCGVCLTASLAEDVRQEAGVEIRTGSTLADLMREPDGFTAILQCKDGLAEESVGQVFVASGFSHLPEGDSGNLSVKGSPAFLYGKDLEKILRSRKRDGIFEKKPEQIGFLFCFGSRNPSHGAAYCSKICCGYATRSARALKYMYPDAEITMFYMDMQSVKSGAYLQEMRENGFNMVRCRPNRIDSEGESIVVRWEDSDGIHKKPLDLCIACGGIRPGTDNRQLSQLTGLGLTADGFLEPVSQPEKAGIWIAGTVEGPMSIADTMADARVKAAELIAWRRKEAGV